MKKFLFQVGDRVRWKKFSDHSRGNVIARGRYTKRAAKFLFTPGSNYYLIDGMGGPLRVVVEEFLKKTR